MPVTAEAYAEAVSGLRWYGLSLLPYTANMIMQNYCQSAKRTLAANVISFMDGFGSLFVFALFLLNVIGFHGLWLTFFLGKAGVFLACVVYSMVKSGKVSISLDDLLGLGDDFDVPLRDRFIAAVTSCGDVADLSERVMDFCRGRGIDEKRCFYAGLAIEEMCVIIIDEGFGDGRAHQIDIKLQARDGRLLIRLRDDCGRFDARQRERLMQPSDPLSGPGIRLLFHAAQDIDYYGALSVNYLTMEV